MVIRVVQACNEINTNLTRLHQLLDCGSYSSRIMNFVPALLGIQIVPIRHVAPQFFEVYY